MAKASMMADGMRRVSVARPTPVAPIALKKYRGLRQREYGPSVTRLMVLYPQM